MIPIDTVYRLSTQLLNHLMTRTVYLLREQIIDKKLNFRAALATENKMIFYVNYNVDCLHAIAV